MTPPGFLIGYGSALILPLSVVEGPVVSVLVGVAAAQGHVGWSWALALLVCGDLSGDLLCYAVGRGGGGPLARLGRRLRFDRVVTPELRRALADNAWKMLLIGKWTHSIGGVVLVGCGMLRVPLPGFLLVNLFATLPKSAVLFGFGYFAGGYWPVLRDHWIVATIALAALGVAAIALVLRRAASVAAGR